METEQLIMIVSKVMKVDPKEVNLNTTFIEDLGADSLDIMRIVLNTEEQFNIKLPKDAVYSINTVLDALNIIKKIKKA